MLTDGFPLGCGEGEAASHPGISIAGPAAVSEDLAWVSVIDLQPGVVRDDPENTNTGGFREGRPISACHLLLITEGQLRYTQEPIEMSDSKEKDQITLSLRGNKESSRRLP